MCSASAGEEFVHPSNLSRPSFLRYEICNEHVNVLEHCPVFKMTSFDLSCLTTCWGFGCQYVTDMLGSRQGIRDRCGPILQVNLTYVLPVI